MGFRWFWFLCVVEFVKKGCGKRDYRATSPRVDDQPFHCLILQVPPLCSVTVTAADRVYRSLADIADPCSSVAVAEHHRSAFQ